MTYVHAKELKGVTRPFVKILRQRIGLDVLSELHHSPKLTVFVEL